MPKRRWTESSGEAAYRVIERALQFEELANNEADPNFKSELLKQADAYRKLAAQRAQKYGLPPPSMPPRDTP
ncbi:hypothetical protein BSZ21_05835 [Bradyrhizobium canariense]|uniref:hypothetical protein n=1 Tax=Bradyrhizobium canariense TaxID=255045 RepID=UPI000A18CEA4|nr:hypothetical protein [Bradyrhizobium canariense]OSI74428.1 hypothetical protein BSZ21_05835 [Bradyrhizobium canariense]